MGTYLAKRRDAAAAKARSDEIDKQIEEDSDKLRKECKILLLGSDESGKTTIAKQMKIIHQTGFTTEELIAYKPIIYKNSVDSAQAIVRAMREIGVDCVTPENRTNVERIAEYQLGPLPSSSSAMPQPATNEKPVTNEKSAANFTLPAEIAEAIHQLWNDPIIPQIMDRSSEFYLMDSAQYFFDDALRIGSVGYVPTESDVLHVREKSTGITETRFDMGQLSINIIDIGRWTDRRKWIHYFESVTSVIFCTALSEYDQVLPEERSRTQMMESLALFEAVVNSRWFLRTAGFVLFLNKIDLFKIKLQKTPLERYFPEYAGGPDVNKAVRYILWQFMYANRARLPVYPYTTQATDTENIRLVFAAVVETIVQTELRVSDLL